MTSCSSTSRPTTAGEMKLPARWALGGGAATGLPRVPTDATSCAAGGGTTRTGPSRSNGASASFSGAASSRAARANASLMFTYANEPRVLHVRTRAGCLHMQMSACVIARCMYICAVAVCIYELHEAGSTLANVSSELSLTVGAASCMWHRRETDSAKM